MKLSTLLTPDHVLLNLRTDSHRHLLETIATELIEDDKSRLQLVEMMLHKDEEYPVTIGNGVAVDPWEEFPTTCDKDRRVLALPHSVCRVSKPDQAGKMPLGATPIIADAGRRRKRLLRPHVGVLLLPFFSGAESGEKMSFKWLMPFCTSLIRIRKRSI